MEAAQNPGFLRRTASNVISGTIAGIGVCAIGHPFDTLKVRLQTQPVKSPVYSGLIDCFLKTLKWEGIGGLYKGVASPLAGQMIFRATLFTAYFQVQSSMTGPDRVGQRLTSTEYFKCGVVTGFFASFSESPIDLFKTKMQIQIIRAKSGSEVQYRHVFHAGYVIGRTYGIRGVYQGLGATFARNLPAFGAFFGFYETIRTALTPEGGTVEDLNAPSMMLAGAVGGTMYWVSIYPIDVVRSAMQADDSRREHRRFRNIAHCFRRLYVEEGGWRRFFRGFSPCLLRSLPVNGTQLFVLEKCRQFFS